MSRTGMILAGLGVVAFVAVLYLAFGPTDDPRIPAEPDGPDVGGPSRPGNVDSGGEEPEPLAAPTKVEARDMVQILLDGLRGKGPGLPPQEMDRIRNTEEGVQMILDIIRGDFDDDTRAAAIFMLGASSFGPATDVVERGVSGEYGPELRTAAIVSLAGADPKRALPILESVFLTDKDEGVSTAALQAIARHWDRPMVLQTWLNLLERAPEGSARAFLYLGLGNMIPPIETEEPESITEFRSTLRGLPTTLGPVPPEEEEIYARMLEMALAETKEEYRIPAADFVAKLRGDASRKAFLEFWDKAGEPQRQQIMGLLHPEIGGEKLADFVRLAPTMEEQEYRRILSGHLELWHDPDLLPDIERWAQQEKDEDIRERLEKTAARLRGE